VIGKVVEVIEPEWPWGASLREELQALGIDARPAVAGAAVGAAGSRPPETSGGDPPAGLTVEAIASRVPLDAAALQALEQRCAERHTAVVAFQADAFLGSLSHAGMLVSACDATPLTRRVVAGVLASYFGNPPRPARD
jgi:hypothetical protein